MFLYDHPFSPYAQKVRIMLREKGLQFEKQIPDGLGSGDDLGYSAHNPRLEVPALVVEYGETLFDSTIIVEYLEDRYPNPPMRALDPLVRARAREIEEVCDTHYEAINWGVSEIRFFARGAAIADKLRQSADKEISAIHSWLEARIGQSGWLNGPEYGMADISVVPFVTMSQILGFPPAEGSPLNGWLERVMQRPAVAETIGEAAEAVAGMVHYHGLLEAGGFRRQFRDHRLEWLIRAGGMEVLLDGLAKDNVRFTDVGKFRR